ncbi:hypothetical protein SLA2020_395860 [Shorea laevis]
MLIFSPVTPAQLSVVLGLVPIIAAWIYAEYLEYTKNSLQAKVGYSDVNLVEAGEEVMKEDDRAVLLEGGALQSASPISRISSSASPIFRFLMMDEAFLIENRLTLTAISEFGALLAYFYICDRTDVFGSSKKSYNWDLFLFLYFLLIIVSAITSFKRHHDKSPFSGKSILYLNRHQTDEWKGWMQIHYFAAAEIYDAIRVFIAVYVWMTGFGNFSYYCVRKDFSLARFALMMWQLHLPHACSIHSYGLCCTCLEPFHFPSWIHRP